MYGEDTSNSSSTPSPSKDGLPVFTSPDSVIKIKVVVVGELSVGKTSLAFRFTKGTFQDHYVPTVGASFLVRAVEMQEKTIIFQIWDTAGQERFRSLVPMYLRDAKIGILVYDVTDKSTFADVGRWLIELHKHSPADTKIALVGNKSDLEECREVTTTMAQEYATENGLYYLETSAKTGRNVETLFRDMAEVVKEDFDKTTSQSGHSIKVSRTNSLASNAKRRCCRT